MHASCPAHVTSDMVYIKSCLLDSFRSEFPTSMLLLLILQVVYVLHSFQTHAAPLTSLLAESRDTVLSTPACICPADQRTIWDILWSCLATIFACSWVSVHPNIPASNESWWRIFLRRLELMFWAVVAPESIISWALRQWFGARDLERIYKGGQMHPIYSQY